MNARLVLWLLVYVALAALSLRGRVWAVVLYLLSSLIAPHRWWWGTAVIGLPLMDLSVAILASAVILHRRREIDVLPALDPVMTGLSLLTVINLTAVTCWAVSFDLSLVHAVQKMKLLLTFNLLIAGIRSERDLKTVLLSLMVMISLLSVESYLTHTKGGRLERFAVSGVAGSNQIGSFWVSLIPLYLGLFLERGRLIKLGTLAALPFTLNLVLRTASRGAFLGLGTGFASLFVISNRQTRKYLLIAGVLLSGMFFYLLRDPELIERFLGIQGAAEVDVSAQSRLAFWKVGMLAIQDHPAGLGGECWDKFVSVEYLAAAGLSEVGRSVHQAFLSEALAWGCQGLALLLCLQFVSLRRAYRSSRLYTQLSDSHSSVRVTCYAAGLVAVLVTCLFGDYQNYDNSYFLFMLASVDYRLASIRLDAASQVSPQVNTGSLPARWQSIPPYIAPAN